MRKPWIALSLLVLLSGPGRADAPPLTDRQRIIHFLNRAGYGPTPGDVDRIERQGFFFYTEDQCRPELIDDSAVERRIESLFPVMRMSAAEARFNFMDPDEVKRRQAQHLPVPAHPQGVRTILDSMVGQRLLRDVNSERQLQQIMVDFWMNHFNIDWDKNQDRWLMPSYERDVIRPHALGRFRDLLGATAHSPAMMIYLDNWVSSRLVPADPKKKGSKPSGGVNENYARELMELHTMGVDGGYTQHDVTEVARCLTGWTVGAEKDGWPFVFRADKHDDGPKVVLGMQIPAHGGEKDGDMVLDLLARHPSTAHFLATKLCRYFVSDDPPERLVDQVAAVYLRTDGDIAAMVKTILESRDFWSAEAYHAKVKNPLFLVASALRATDTNISDTKAVENQLSVMGMAAYQCEPPTGYKDTAEAWISAGSLVQRFNFSLALANNKVPGLKMDLASVEKRIAPPAPGSDTVDALLQTLMAGEVSDKTRDDLEQLTVPPQGKANSPEFARLVGMILGSPEFQRR